MTGEQIPSGGSIIPGSGPHPMVKQPNEPAEVEKLYSLADVDPLGPFNGLFYGAPGTGKTVFAASLPPPFRWLDLDRRGIKSIHWAYRQGMTSIKDPKKDLIAYCPTEELVGHYPNLPKAYDKATDMLDYWVHRDRANWETLVVDSLTEWNSLAIYKGLHLNGQFPDKKRPLSHSDQINESAREHLLTGEQDYKSAMGVIQSTIDELRSECHMYGKNLICICHEWTQEETDAQGRTIITQYLPLMIGQLRTRVVKSFDDVWRFVMQAGKVEPLMSGDYRYIAKTRWGNIPDIAKPNDKGIVTYGMMLEKVKAFHGIK